MGWGWGVQQCGTLKLAVRIAAVCITEDTIRQVLSVYDVRKGMSQGWTFKPSWLLKPTSLFCFLKFRETQNKAWIRTSP